MFIKILFLAGLVRLLLVTDKPFLCSGLYTAAVIVFELVFGASFPRLAVVGVVTLAVSSLYFWLLHRLDSSSALWWLVAIVGIGVAFL